LKIFFNLTNSFQFEKFLANFRIFSFLTNFWIFFLRFSVLNSTNKFGVSYGNILRHYLQRVNSEVKQLKPSDPLFIRGNPPNLKKKSSWTYSPIGHGTLREVPRFIAGWLKLPNASLHTSHSVRRTTATLAAEGAANAEAISVRIDI
jgi:hypothetical protein